MLLLFSYKVISNSEIPWIAASQASLSFTVSQSLLRFRSIESMMLSNHLILWYCLLLLHLIFPSIGVFSNELPLCIRWPKDYSGLISFRIDWFDLLAVKGLSRVFSSTVILKHHFFGAQPSLWSNSYGCTFIIVQSLSCVWLFATLWTTALLASPSFTIS